MTVRELASVGGFRFLCESEPDRAISGVYVGDLLSWVMGRADEDNLWLTIMTNINVIAVASLVNVSAVILCEGCTPDAEVCRLAKEKGLNLLVSEERIYECSLRLGSLLA